MSKTALDTVHNVLIDINSRAALAFGLALVAALLTYIAFFK